MVAELHCHYGKLTRTRVPIANSGIGQPDSNAHAPNENVVIDEFLRGMRHAARIMERMSEL